MERKQIFGVLVGVILCVIMLFAGLYLTGQIGTKKNVVPAAAEVQTTETTVPATTAQTTAETTTVTTTTTAQSAESLSAAEKEQLHTIYGEKLTIVGDSIAYGFNAYGYVSDEQNLAQGSVGIRNIHDFSFEQNGQEVDVLDALEERQPAYIYMSMGMNDVNMCTEEEYVNYYQEAITSIQQICPDSNIVVAGITPVAADSDYTDNADIRKFNEGLEQMVADLQQPNVVYFDAYSIVADPDTEALNPDNSGGDGIHLASTVYQELLDAVYPVLDTMPVPAAIQELLQQSDFSTTEEETEQDFGADSESWTDSETDE